MTQTTAFAELFQTVMADLLGIDPSQVSVAGVKIAMQGNFVEAAIYSLTMAKAEPLIDQLLLGALPLPSFHALGGGRWLAGSTQWERGQPFTHSRLGVPWHG